MKCKSEVEKRRKRGPFITSSFLNIAVAINYFSLTKTNQRRKQFYSEPYGKGKTLSLHNPRSTESVLDPKYCDLRFCKRDYTHTICSTTDITLQKPSTRKNSLPCNN